MLHSSLMGKISTTSVQAALDTLSRVLLVCETNLLISQAKIQITMVGGSIAHTRTIYVEDDRRSCADIHPVEHDHIQAALSAVVGSAADTRASARLVLDIASDDGQISGYSLRQVVSHATGGRSISRRSIAWED